MQTPTTDPFEQRRHKLEELRRLGCEPFTYRFDRTHNLAALHAEFDSWAAEKLEQDQPRAQLAGRLVALRGHGKVAFAHIDDGRDRMQFYIRRDTVGEENFRLFELLDLGDIIGAQGRIFRTKTGELTLFVDQVSILSKALCPPPEKWHGLTDVETRYRQRYVDLMVNSEVRNVFLTRARLVRELRDFLEARGYLEVETPMMQVLPGGATARPFETFHKALGIPLYLRVAPELYLKRLIVGGFDRVYEINRNFRNEGVSTQHNPEFTMLEFYQAYSDYEDLMQMTDELLRTVAERVCGTLQVEYGEHKISFESCERYTVLDSIRHFWNRDQAKPAPEQLRDRAELERIFAASRIPIPREIGPSAGVLQGLLFETIVEPQLIQPTIIYDYPIETSPLSKVKRGDPALVERFELFIAGMEIANAYSELNDPDEQRRRFEAQIQARERGDEEAHRMDEDYLRALSYGMPPTAGEGIGIDRLAMVLTNSRSIREVILFPHLRPED
ncbi:MAG: lysine--tRNA ligase [Acidobacteriota bacterium]